jgi:hypothetical protein
MKYQKNSLKAREARIETAIAVFQRAKEPKRHLGQITGD